MPKSFRVALSLVFAAILISCGEATQSATTLEQLSVELAELEKVCPSKLLSSNDISYEDLTDRCRSDEVSCVVECSAGTANACFALGNKYVTEDDSYTQSQLFFKESCRLGIASGCTNAAAGMLNADEFGEGNCLIDSFKGACSLGDPWGCTMQAILQADIEYIDIVERDFESALEALEGSCLFGLDDPACSAAQSIKAMILEKKNE